MELLLHSSLSVLDVSTEKEISERERRRRTNTFIKPCFSSQ